MNGLAIQKPPSRGLQPARPRRFARVFLVGAACSAALAGCARKASPPPQAPGVSKTATVGPLTVTLTVTPGELPFADRAQVVVEVVADKDVIVAVEEYERLPVLIEHQYEYRLTRGQRQSAVPQPDGRLTWRSTYELEFFLPGEYELPPASASFEASTKTNASGEAVVERQTAKTEPLTVHAKDPNATALTPEELRKITLPPPMELPTPWTLAWWVAGFVVVVVFAIWLLGRRRREAAALEIQLPAHEWARREIARLVGDDLIMRGFVQEFYYRVSGIVRGYIERRFTVSAPEMTTEEFLIAAAGDERFGRDRGQLDEFLTACDLVKYARQIPDSSEADRVVHTAVAFVDRTREDAISAYADELQEASAR